MTGVVCVLLFAVLAASQKTCKEEYRVKTRDGIELTTFVTIPEPCDVKRSVVIDRTPYGPTVDLFAEAYVPEGFISVMQNQRGCFTSGGVYNFWKQDGPDAYDTMAWIVNQSWSNGEIYLAGISADAISAYSDFIIPNPFIKGGYMMWGSAFGHETSYWGGAYRTDLISHWLLGLNTCPNAPQIETQVRQHEAYDDWWALLEANGPYGNHFPNVQGAAVTQAGWWDIFQQGQLDTYAGVTTYGDPSIRDKQYLFVIPLGHCTERDLEFGFPGFEILAPQEMSVAIFKNDWSNEVFGRTDKLNLYVFGPVPKYLPADVQYIGNYWTSIPAWPKTTPTNYYVQANGVLSKSMPTSSGSLTYTYDPKNPSPTNGGNNLFSSSPCGPLNQSALVESRSDILKWTSSALTLPLAICGKITASLVINSDVVDTDFMVAVTDVYPDGYTSSLVRYGAIRMKWRDSPYNYTLMTPGTDYAVTVDLWSTAYIFNAGHKIRVTITSSNAPQFSPNPNNGYPLFDESGPLIVAHNTIKWSTSTGKSTYVTLPVVPETSLPINPKIR